MRIGLLRTPIEIWSTKKTVNEFGIEDEVKELMMTCPAAIKEKSHVIAGDTTKSIVSTLEMTIRYNRYFQTPNSSMYIMLDGLEYDIITPPNNSWRLNKYISFEAQLRSK